MRVLHAIPSLSRTEGGPTYSLEIMERALDLRGVSVTVVTTDDDGAGGHLDVPLGVGVSTGVSERYYFRRQLKRYKFSHPLAKWVQRNVASFDVVHVHALFSHASVSTAASARGSGVPYVIRPLGVLNRYGMRSRRALAKRLSLRWIEGPLVRGAAAVQFTSVQELEEAGAVVDTSRARVVPLAVDTRALQATGSAEDFLSRFPGLRGKEIVLFLGRLDPKKGLEILFEAVERIGVRRPESVLVVAGDGAPEYKEKLREMACSLESQGRIFWAGFLDGDEKRGALHAARAFALPSMSENFGVAAVEALAAGTPVILSEEVAIAAEVKSAGAGVVVRRSAEEIGIAIEQVLSQEEVAATLSERARWLATTKYSVEALGLALVELYGAARRMPERSGRGHRVPA